MRSRMMMYLEDYARKLTDEIDQLIQLAEREGDMEAGREAAELERRVLDIRRIVSYLSTTRTLKD